MIRGAVILPDRLLQNGLVAYEGGRITGVWDLEATPAPPHGGAFVLERGYIAPGFIDLHVHGGGGGDFMDGDPESVAAVTTAHARGGTTGLLATTLTAGVESICQALRAAAAAPLSGARILGFHVEGPFISPRYPGAQEPSQIRLPSISEIDRWLAAVAPTPADRPWCWQVTLAPELPGALAAIAHLASRGVVVAAGHTDCTYGQLQAAVGAGLCHVTHLYNAMRPLHHREPGALGGALALPGLTVELIADGIHIHPGAIALALAARGPSAVILVTDAMRAALLGDGQYRLHDLTATVRDGAARLADGTLAGSVLTMAGAVRTLVRQAGVDLVTAVRMASLQPAARHRLDGRKGSIAPGKDADLLLLDAELKVLATVVEGETVFDGR